MLDQGDQESSADVATCTKSSACEEVLPGAEVEEVGEVPDRDDGEGEEDEEEEWSRDVIQEKFCLLCPFVLERNYMKNV